MAVGSFLVAGSLAVGSLLSKLLAALCAIRPLLGSALLHAALLAAAHRYGHEQHHKDDRDRDDDHHDTGTHR